MFINCPNCKKDIQPGIDKNTLKDKQVTKDTVAICPECRKQVPLNQFVLKTLITLKQFDQPPRGGSAFSFACEFCNKNEPATLSKDGKQAFCGHCGKKLNITDTMIRAMVLSKKGGV